MKLNLQWHLLQDTKEEELVHFFGQFDGAKSAQMRLFKDRKDDPWKFSGSVFLTFDDKCFAQKVTKHAHCLNIKHVRNFVIFFLKFAKCAEIQNFAFACESSLFEKNLQNHWKFYEIILNFIQFCEILHNYMNIYTSIQMFMQLYKISHFAFACEILV